MKIIFLVLFARLGFSQEVNVVYPYEGQQVPSVKAVYLFGNVSPEDGTLLINGRQVKVYPNGAFLAYLPVEEGDFAFNCELSFSSETIKYSRHVKVGEIKKTGAVWVDENSLAPSAALTLKPGDWVYVSAKAASGLEGSFTISGVGLKKQLFEYPSGSGWYQGAYLIRPEDSAQSAQIMAEFSGGGQKVKVQAKGKLTISTEAWSIEASTPNVGVRTDAGGYELFMPQGARAVADGRSEGKIRLALASGETGWVDDDKVKKLPAGFPPPRAQLGSISVKSSGGSTFLYIGLSQSVPCAVEETDGALALTFYYSSNGTDRIIYDASDDFVKEITWKQTSSNTCRLNIKLGEGAILWGYDINYSGGVLTVELRHKPKPAAGGRPLEGIKIVLDPGHSAKRLPPYDGAVGPTGLFEFEANLAIAREAEAELKNLGAELVLTRQGEEEVPLVERPRAACRSRGDLFISLHNNALPISTDPFAEPRGFSIYYYQPHSRALAEAAHEAYCELVPLPDESFRWSDFHVIRLTQMPSILVENAYMILPEQEQLLSTPEFARTLAVAVSRALLKLFQAGQPAVRPERQTVE